MSYDIVEIPAPLVLLTARIVGVTSYKPLVFFLISTPSSSYTSSTSSTSFPVNPSRTTNSGFVLYPIPAVLGVIESNVDSASTLMTVGKNAVGLRVLSEE